MIGRLHFCLTLILVVLPTGCERSESPSSPSPARYLVNGDSWIKIGDGVIDQSVYTLNADNTGIVFAGTVNDVSLVSNPPDQDLRVPSSSSMFSSTDDGTTWGRDLWGSYERGYFASIGINVRGHIFALETGVSETPDEQAPGHFYRSMDRGNFWTRIDDGFNLRGSFAFGFGDTVFASDVDFLLMSTNGGNTWTKNNWPGGTYANALLFTTMRHLFAGMPDGLYRSVDCGQTWTKTGLDVSVDCLSPTPGGTLLAHAGSAVFRSADNGTTWTQAFVSGVSTHFSAFAFDSYGNIFAANGGSGVLRSSDDGKTWVPVNNGFPRNISVRSLTISSNGYIFAATSDGIYRSR